MSLFSHPFMVNALLAGTGIALACGLVGYFLVLRAQVFTGDALSHVAFTGALAALAFGIDLRVGLFASCVLMAVLFALLEGFDRALVVGVDDEDAGFGDAEPGDLLHRDLGAVRLDLELVDERRVGPSGAHAGELVDDHLLGLDHFFFRLQ